MNFGLTGSARATHFHMSDQAQTVVGVKPMLEGCGGLSLWNIERLKV
jgi:hypothetical protein